MIVPIFVSLQTCSLLFALSLAHSTGLKSSQFPAVSAFPSVTCTRSRCKVGPSSYGISAVDIEERLANSASENCGPELLQGSKVFRKCLFMKCGNCTVLDDFINSVFQDSRQAVPSDAVHMLQPDRRFLNWPQLHPHGAAQRSGRIRSFRGKIVYGVVPCRTHSGFSKRPSEFLTNI